jgi:hypothetical protein
MAKTLAALAILASSVLGFNDVGKLDLNIETERTAPDTRIVYDDIIEDGRYREPSRIIGEITQIDEDYLLAQVVNNENNNGQIVSFPFENLRIKDESGNVHKVVTTGPTGYAVGDKVSAITRPGTFPNDLYATDLIRERNILCDSPKLRPIQNAYLPAKRIAVYIKEVEEPKPESSQDSESLPERLFSTD